MPFFARPNLDNEQFKQLPDSILSLSGTTQIANVTGLTLTDGVGDYIPIIATGGSNNYVLTYDDSGVIPVIKLKESTASGGTGVYPYPDKVLCAVGGITGGTCLYNMQVVDILQEILVPTLNPTLTAPSSTFTISCLPTTSTGYYEFGTTVCLTGCSTFNRGCVNPAYCCVFGDGSDKRSGFPAYHCFSDWGSGVQLSTSGLSTGYTFTPRIVYDSSQSVSSRVFYEASTNNVLNSSGGVFCSPLPSGCTAAVTRTILGTFPYFWGTSATLPVPNQALINGYDGKCVSVSNGTISVTNFNAVNEYIWLAIPASSQLKTCWQGANNPSNNGVIPGGLFPSSIPIYISSPDSCPWEDGGTNYRLYVSSYPTSINYDMTFYN